MGKSKDIQIIQELAQRLNSEAAVEKELTRFQAENPNATPLDIAKHFFNYRVEHEKFVNDNIMKFYGD